MQIRIRNNKLNQILSCDCLELMLYRTNSGNQLSFFYKYMFGHAENAPIYLKSSNMASSSTINLALLEAYKNKVIL
jgi:uncharacterized phosphosugar-binding protein